MAQGHQEGLALFRPRPTDTSIEKIEYVEFRPVSVINRNNVIEFNIDGNGSCYIDLHSTKLHVKARILHKDGTPVSENDKVAFANFTLSSLFKQCNVSFQQKLISSCLSTHYAYHGALNTLLNFSEDAKESHLQSQMFYKDTAGFMDSTDPTIGGNAGFNRRWIWTNNGKCVDMEGPIHIPIMQQGRFLLNGVQMNIKLFPSSDSFVLMASEDNYKVDIVDSKLKVCFVKVNDDIILSQDVVLKTAPALYPYTSSTIKSYSIPKGTLTWSIDNVFLNDVPDKVYVALTSAEAFSGHIQKNPFNFQHMNVRLIGFDVNGRSQPSVPFTPHYEDSNYIEPYLSLYNATGRYQKDIGNYIGKDEYPFGYCIYAFDLSCSHTDTFANKKRKGHTRLNIQFGIGLNETVTAIVYGQFPAIMKIDHARNVYIEEQ